MPYNDIKTPLSLGYEGVNPPLSVPDDPVFSDEYLQEKSLKYNYTLGKQSPGMPNILQTARSGLLKKVAQNVVDQDKLEDMKAKNQILSSFAEQNKGEPLDPQTYDFVQSLTKEELKEAVNDPQWDANAVYAKKLANEQLNNDPYPWQEVFKTPASEEKYHGQRDVAETHIAWRESLFDMANEITAKMDSKSIFGKGYEYTEQWVVPFASYFNKSQSGGSWWLGKNQAEYYQKLWSMPLQQRYDQIKKDVAEISQDNLLDAREFVQGALDYGKRQETLDNIFTGLEVGTSLPIVTAGKLIKGGKGAIKGGQTVVPKRSDGAIAALTRGSDEKQEQMLARKIKARGTPVADKRVVAKAPVGKTVNLNGMGNAITGNLYEMLWKKVQKGDVTELGKPSPFLKAAQSEFIAGRLSSAADLQKFANKGPKPKPGKAPMAPREPNPFGPDGKPTKEFQEYIDKVDDNFQKFLDSGGEPDYKPEVALGDIVQATDPANPNIISDTLAATGRSAEGAAVKAQKISAIETAKEPPKTARATVERDSLTPTMYDVNSNKLPEPPITKITNALAMRINDAMKRVTSVLDEAIFSSKSVATRFSSEDMLQQARKVAETDFARLYPKVGDAVIDVSMRTPEDSFGNVVEVYTTFGRPDKTLFKQPMHANAYARRHYNLREGTFDVTQHGNEYAIRVQTISDESKLSDFLIPTTGENSSPTSVANTFLGYLRTQDDLISQTSIENRKAVTHAYSMLQREVKGVGDLIAAVKRWPGRMARFERVLDDGLNSKRMVQHTDEWTGETKEIEVVGKEWNMAGFERRYMELNNGAMPSETEILAYETYKKLLKFDLAIRNLDLYRDKAILGITEWRFRGLRQNAKGEMVRGWSNTFDGKLLDDLPYDHPEDTIVAVHSDVDGFNHIFDTKKMSQNNREFLQKLKDEGYRIIQVANPDVKPLSNMLRSNEVVNFVMVKESQASPLKLAQLPRTQGGHRILNEGWHVKQPKMNKAKRTVRDKDGKETEVESGKTSYEGDITVAGVHSEAKAKEMVPLMEKARQLFKQGDQKAFNEWVEKYLPREPHFLWDDFKKGVLDPDHPFYVTKSGQGVNDTEGFRNSVKDTPNFVDAVDSSFNLYRRLNKKFAGEKSPDVLSFSKEGTSEGNPVLKFKTARYIDPLKAMQTAMSSLMRNRAYSDYVIHSTNSWIEEFGDLLKVEGGMQALRANPLHYLHNPSWIDKPVARDRLAAAKNARLAVVNILGTQSELRNNIDWLKGKAIDSVYKNIGDDASRIVSDKLLPTQNDPLAYVRGAAFHMKLGMFNPVQIWTQAQTLVHMTALTGNPLRAGSSYSGTVYMQMLQMTDNPKIIDHVAGLASKSGWGSKEDFLESLSAMKKTGLWYVEGEHGWVNDVLDPEVFEGVVGKALNKGALFFKGTERFVRLASWNIAFKEWKLANPGRMLTKRSDINKVLARQDLLSLNMTNASAANIQKGVFSLSTQFFGYQMRIIDQLFGKRLTAAEKMRVLSAYSLAYGVPVGGGMGLVTPWFGDILEYAERDGIKVDEGAAQLFFQGGLSFLTEWALGDEYNPGKRYGPGGFEFVKNLLDDGFGQDGLLTLMGASTGILMDSARWAQPGLTSLWSSTMNDEEDALPLEKQDFIDAFRSISTVNNAVKAYQAMYFNSYFTRDGKKIATADDIDAVAIGLFGLTPSAIDSMYRQMDFIKEQGDATDSLKTEYTKNMRRALRAPDKATRALYLKRARIMAQSAQIDSREAAKWFQQALKGDEELIGEIDKEYRELIEKRNTQ